MAQRSRGASRNQTTRVNKDITQPKGRGTKRIDKPGEKKVRATEKTLGVGPVREGRDAKRPLPKPAMDRRRQIVGTDDPVGQ